MIILYILLIAYLLAVNFYAFLYVKSLRDKELEKQSSTTTPQAPVQNTDKFIGKLCVTGILGGAITIYVCMFLFKFRRNDLLLMVLMPLFGVLNIYITILLFRSGFSFLFFRR